MSWQGACDAWKRAYDVLEGRPNILLEILGCLGRGPMMSGKEPSMSCKKRKTGTNLAATRDEKRTCGRVTTGTPANRNVSFQSTR